MIFKMEPIEEVAERLVYLVGQSKEELVKNLVKEFGEREKQLVTLCDIERYVHWTDTTAIYPEKGEGSNNAIAYVALGFSGEAGEVANEAKKLLRGDMDFSKLREKLIDEIGDTLWYIARLCKELNVTITEVLLRNRNKLLARKAKNEIKGPRIDDKPN